jgi:hypothetical protein
MPKVIETPADVAAVMRERGVSRRQAEHAVATEAHGYQHDDAPMGTVAVAQRQHAPVTGGARDQGVTAVIPPDEYIATVVRPELSTDERMALQHEAARQAIYVKNVEAGYDEWLGMVTDPDERARLDKLVNDRRRPERMS